MFSTTRIELRAALFLFLILLMEPVSGLRQSPGSPWPEISFRRMREIPALAKIIEDCHCLLNQSQDDITKVLWAVTMIKLGEKKEGYKVLRDMEGKNDPWLWLEIARAWLDLEDRKLGLGILDFLGTLKDSISEKDSANVQLLIFVAEEYFKQGEHKKAKDLLQGLKLRVPGEGGSLLQEIKMREEIEDLKNQTRDENTYEQRIAAAQKLLRMSNDISTGFEEIRMIKDAIWPLARASDKKIRIELTKGLEEGSLVSAWQAGILMDLIGDQELGVADAAVQAARNIGEKYILAPAEIQGLRTWYKTGKMQRITDIDYSPDMGNLFWKEKMVSALIEAWRVINSPEVEDRLRLQKNILEAVGFWGIDSQKAKDFLSNEVPRESEMEPERGRALKRINDNETKFRKELETSAAQIARIKKEGRIPPDPEFYKLVFQLGALWTIYGFPEARKQLLEIDALLLPSQEESAPLRKIEWVFYNLMFRPDDAVLERLESHFRGNDILRQSFSVRSLIESWWMEGNERTKLILKDFLRHLAYKELSKVSLDNYFERLMAERIVYVLLRYNPSYPERLELASMALQVLAKAPPREYPQFPDPYRGLVRLIGEGLKKGF